MRTSFARAAIRVGQMALLTRTSSLPAAARIGPYSSVSRTITTIAPSAATPRPFSPGTIADGSVTPDPSTSPSHHHLPPPPPPPRWLDDLRARIGRCITFGCSGPQISRAAAVLRTLAGEWRELLAGSEGFLTGGRRGLDRQRIAWGEMDSFGHVNNVNYYRYAESARVNWITNLSVRADPPHRDEWAQLMSPTGTGLIIRSLKCDFKMPLIYPDAISVYHRLRSDIPAAGTASSAFVLDCVVLSHARRRVAARLEEEVAVYDYGAARKAADMPAFMRGLFADMWRLQEAEAARARARVWDLVGRVERLEKETWDREGAVEDMGSD